ncbi:hypothetical protein F5H01DRAFT_117449 [Linnemannia elongata]|nr:hypothetical protein F5H01DRAFT_117449 [Linnemannia elongata]
MDIGTEKDEKGGEGGKEEEEEAVKKKKQKKKRRIQSQSKWCEEKSTESYYFFGSLPFCPCSIKAKRLIADTFVCLFVSLLSFLLSSLSPTLSLSLYATPLSLTLLFIALAPLIPSPFSFLGFSSKSPFLPSSLLVAHSSSFPSTSSSSHKQAHKLTSRLSPILPLLLFLHTLTSYSER